jgi:hypothetical protein
MNDILIKCPLTTMNTNLMFYIYLIHFVFPIWIPFQTILVGKHMFMLDSNFNVANVEFEALIFIAKKNLKLSSKWQCILKFSFIVICCN